jgi:hypothetical protein
MTELEELKRSLIEAGLEAGRKIGELREANTRLLDALHAAANHLRSRGHALHCPSSTHAFTVGVGCRCGFSSALRAVDEARDSTRPRPGVADGD